MAKSDGSFTFILCAASPIAFSKEADQPAPNNCSGFVPTPGPPGLENCTSRWPSELRDAPSRPPVVWTLAVWSSFSSWLILDTLASCRRVSEVVTTPSAELLLVLSEPAARLGTGFSYL